MKYLYNRIRFNYSKYTQYEILIRIKHRIRQKYYKNTVYGKKIIQSIFTGFKVYSKYIQRIQSIFKVYSKYSKEFKVYSKYSKKSTLYSTVHRIRILFQPYSKKSTLYSTVHRILI